MKTIYTRLIIAAITVLSVFVFQTNQVFAQEDLVITITGKDTLCPEDIPGAYQGFANGIPGPITFPNPRWTGTAAAGGYLAPVNASSTLFTPPIPLIPTSYTLIYTAIDGNGVSWSNTKTVVVMPTPSLVNVSPLVQTWCQGDNITLTASGCTNYYWYRDDCASGPITTFVGSGPSINITLSTAGTCIYRVYGEGVSGCLSAPQFIDFTINVGEAATANAGPDQTICAGNNATLAGSIGGSATMGTWTTSGSGSFLPNPTTLNATYVPSAADITAGFVILTLTTDDPPGNCTAASDNMRLDITPAIANNIIAADQTICSGDVPVGLTGTLPTGGGGGYTYQWQSSTAGAGGPFADIGGATGQNYAPPALLVSTWYRRVVTTAACGNHISNVVAILVNAPIANNIIAADQTICAGDTPVGLTGTLPTGGNGVYTYQWESSTTGAGGPFAAIAGATAQNYAPGPLAVTTWYRRIVTSPPCSNSTSNVIQITVNPLIANNIIAADQTICAGDTPAGLTGTLPTGGNGVYTYQWESSTTGAGGPFAVIAGATAQNYAPGPLAVTTWYRRIVTSPPCANSTSNVIQILVNPAIANNVIAADQTICSGDTPAGLTGTIPSGGSGVYSYQWQSSTTGAGGPFANIAGATGQNYAPGPLAVTTWYRRMVTSPPCAASPSNVIRILVNPLIANNTIAADQTICAGDTPAGLTGSVPTGGSGVYTYQWQNSTTGAAGPYADIAGATAQNYAPGPLAVTTWYRRVVISAPCSNSFSNVVQILVNPAIANNIIAADQTICAGDTPAGLTGTVPTGGNGTYTYQWQSSTTGAGGPFANIAGATGQNYAPGPLAVTTWYRRIVTSPPCANSTSNVIQILVNPAIANNIIAADQTICAGDTPAGLTGTIPTGGSGVYTYQWQSSTTGAGGPFANIAGATGQNYAPGPLAVTTWFRRMVTSPPCAASPSNVVQITVNPAIANNIIAADQTICAGDIPAGLTGTVPTGGSGAYTYQWQSSTTGAAGPFANIAGATGQNYAPGALLVTTWYRRIVNSPPCTNNISNVIQITVNPAIANNIIAADQTICAGDTPTGLTGTIPSGGNGTYTYQWQSSTTGAGGPFTNIAGATGQNYAPGPLLVTTWYRRLVSSPPCTNNTSNVIRILVNPAIANNIIAADQTICSGDTPAPLTGTVPTGGSGVYTYQWQNSTTGASGPFVDIAGATGQNYAPGPLVLTTWYRRVVISAPCANNFSNVVQITVNPPVGNNIICCNQTLCSGVIPDLLTGTIPTGGNGTYTYQWQNSTVGAGGPFANIAGATGQNYQPPLLLVDTWYRRIVSSPPCANSISNVILIDINPSPVAHAGPDNTICINDTITLGDYPAATGGNPPYTYFWYVQAPLSSWTSNIEHPQVYPTVTTTYVLRVTDQTPCIGYDTVVISIWPNTLVADAGGDVNICHGNNGGSAVLGGFPAASGGLPPYTYRWDGIPTYTFNPAGDQFLEHPIVRPTITTQFILTVTDAHGCTATDNMIVTLDPELFADAGNDTSFCYGIGGRLGGDPTASGGTPFPLPPGYQFFWKDPASSWTSNEPNPIVNPTICTTYALEVIDSHGCRDRDTVVVCPNPQIFVDAGRDTVICHGNNGGSYTLGGSPSGSGGTAPLSFWWDDNGSGYFWLPGQQSSQNPVVSPSVSTTFTLTVTDAVGCTASDDVIVDLNGEILANAGPDGTMCNSLNGGRWTLGGRPTGSGGTAPYTYLWSSSPNDPSLVGHDTESNPEVTPLVNTTYYVTVTDASGLGCRDIDSVVISISPEIFASAGNDTTVCFGSFDIRLGGNPTGSGGIAPYTYLWTSNPAYGWTAGQNTQPNPVVTPTITTTFYVSVFDAISCVDIDSMVVNMDPQIIVDAGADTIICTDQPTVTITLGGNPTASGGTPPYIYAWAAAGFPPIPPIANPVVTIPTTVTSITFNVIVYDAVGCSSTDQKVVSFNPLFGADAGNDTTICGPADITLGGNPTAIGGTPPFVYEWSTVPSSGWSSDLPNPVVNVTVSTTFALHITDSHACHAYDTVIVLVDTPLVIDSIQFQNPTTCISLDGWAEVWHSGGTPPYTYNWSTTPPQTTKRATGLDAGVYYVTVYSGMAGGCSATGSVTLHSPFEPHATLIFEPDDEVCMGDSVKVTCLTDPTNTFEWRVDGITIIPPPSSINNITLYDIDHNTEVTCIVDSLGCKLTLIDTVYVITLPGVFAGRDTTFQCPTLDSLQIGSPGVPGYTYQWSSIPTAYISDLTAPMPWVYKLETVTYILRVHDENSGCDAIDSVTVNVIQTIPVFVGNDTLVCKGQCVTIGPGSVPANHVYNWTSLPPGFNSNELNPRVCPFTNTMYIFTMVDTISGCVRKGRVTISVYPTIIEPGNDTIICAGDIITIGGPPQPHYSYSWTSLPPGFTSNISNPTVQTWVPTKYILRVNDSIYNCDVVDTVFVDIDIPPVFAGFDTSVCVGDSARIGSEWPNWEDYTYSWRSEPPGMKQENFTSHTYFMELPLDTVTRYILTMTSNLTGCSSIDTMIVYLKQSPAITITSDKAGNIIFGGQIITFTALPDNYDEYRWFIVPPNEERGEIPDQSGPSNIFKTDRITEDQTEVHCIAINWGCDSQPDTIIVTLKTIPNAFTPNGDGINDVFLEGMDLTIINRWGQTMYLGTGGWDGKYHGQKCSPGTYYYLIRIKDMNNVITVLKGAVTIIDIKQ